MVYSKVIHIYMHVFVYINKYIYILLYIFSTIGYYKILNIVPCDLQ